MSPRLSLRQRVFLGAVLWTIGLFVLGGVGLTLLMRVHPQAPVVVHQWFMQPLIIAAALASMAAGFFQVRAGLSGVDAVRARLAALHDGRQHRLEGAYPGEIQPLVNDLNALLDQREQAIRKAITKAGDLAHGLKTPLALLNEEAGRAEREGRNDIATSIRQHVDRMQRQVDYHLAHARAAASTASSSTRNAVNVSAEGIARVLRRLHADSGVIIDVVVAESYMVRVQREDLDEMLGNLLDNACKWARSRVWIDASTVGGRTVITVDDDGDGLAEDLRQVVLQRGVRADEAAPGSGLGLAIVSDLAEAYGGSVTLGASLHGGLRATLTLPA